jgi:hypothetical protein
MQQLSIAILDAKWFGQSPNRFGLARRTKVLWQARQYLPRRARIGPAMLAQQAGILYPDANGQGKKLEDDLDSQTSSMSV